MAKREVHPPYEDRPIWFGCWPSAADRGAATSCGPTNPKDADARRCAFVYSSSFSAETKTTTRRPCFFRAASPPLVFRFYPAFRNAEHGNADDLQRLEAQFFEELER